ncbi:DNA-binding response regulator [Devosia yakushimensis]|uniref:DNA-binding response regulator n=1 Tax=Devosia yakushimensis TaxID=470028 RepID=A0ABQ5ULH5_9HYPH|nr:response regulator transcription factor [Devosia yakushimensis]GLQ12040.1 DNA-binding response regulator [Devosia yakushimensis]
MRILLVEDETDMARALIAALNRQGIVVDHATTLDIANEAARNDVYDVALLDRKLPDGDGLSLIPILRGVQPGLPIIVLSALNSTDHRVAGLDIGADDYLSKPFSTDELLARIRAILRRPARIGEASITVGKLRFDLNGRFAEAAGIRLDLTRREILALEMLMRRAGRTVSRHALEEAVYGFDDEIASNALDAHISRLRGKLAGAAVQIHAIRGLGYVIQASS